MNKVFIASGRYVQGPEVLSESMRLWILSVARIFGTRREEFS